MILPSEDKLRPNGGHGNSGNVTQPFVTETYRCVASYETKDTKNKPFKVTAEEKLDVLIKDKGGERTSQSVWTFVAAAAQSALSSTYRTICSGWWLVENEGKRMAWFPAPYLEKLENEEDDGEDEIPERGIYTAKQSISTFTWINVSTFFLNIHRFALHCSQKLQVNQI